MAGGILDFFRRLLGVAPGGGLLQFGAIPWRRSASGLEFCLITSRRTGRWIFPKGGRIAWLSASACAAREAFEEAGVEGDIAKRPVGSYHGVKRRDGGGTPILVEMYPLEVRIELEDWPDKKHRQRRWANLEDACSLLTDPELVPMVRALAKRAEEDAAGVANE
jgi:8-oxo-dGTP pyrophosphatase MutT (NUDIX family)